MQGTKVIRVYLTSLKKFDRINSERPQDVSRADTFDYLLRVYDESALRIKPARAHLIAGNVSSPLIDLDNIHIVTPGTLLEKIEDEKRRRDALRAANETKTEETA